MIFSLPLPIPPRLISTAHLRHHRRIAHRTPLIRVLLIAWVLLTVRRREHIPVPRRGVRIAQRARRRSSWRGVPIGKIHLRHIRAPERRPMSVSVAVGVTRPLRAE